MNHQINIRDYGPYKNSPEELEDTDGIVMDKFVFVKIEKMQSILKDNNIFLLMELDRKLSLLSKDYKSEDSNKIVSEIKHLIEEYLDKNEK